MTDLHERPLASDAPDATDEALDVPAPVAVEPTLSGEDPSAVEEERPGALVIVRRFAFVAGLVGLDLWSKSAAFEWLTSGKQLTRDACDFPHPRIPLVGEWFAFMLSRNKGAAFGQLDSVPYLLVGGRIVAVLFLSYLIVRAAAAKRVLSAAFVLILAGALGNLYDNLVLDPPGYDSNHPFGYVRDFIDVYFSRWSWHFPTFNVADSCITVGAVLLLLTGFKSDTGKARKAA